MKKVADWQIAHQKDVKHGALDWTNAALYMGMLDWAELAETEMGDASYYDWLVKLGPKHRPSKAASAAPESRIPARLPDL